MRRKTVALLVVVASLLAPLAITALWLRETVLDTHRYVAVVAPLSSNRAVDSAVASQVTSALLTNVDITKLTKGVLPKQAGFLGVSLNAAVRDYTESLVEKFLTTDEFHQLWIVANTQAQQALRAALEGKQSPFIGPDGNVEIDLSNIVLAARSQIGIEGLHVFDKLGPATLHRRIVIARASSLHDARRAVRALRAAAIALPVLAAVFVGLALLISRERKRTVFWLGAGLAAASLVALVVVALARGYYLDHVVGPDVPSDAAKAIYGAVVHDLRLYLALATFAGVAAAACAVLAGPSRLATRLRSRTLQTAGGLADHAVGESATVGWVAANKATLRTVTVVAGLLLLATADHLTVRFFVELGAGVLVVLGVLEVLSRPRRRAV
jgi:hypothetical protein